MIDIEQVKQKITSILKQKGPSLPIPVSREIDLSPTFTSAILSEMTHEKKVKISNLKVGSSPLYFLQGQEQKLGQHADENLAGAEKSAFLKLKQEKILDDKSQPPAIRVALRSIKDFAVPIRFQDKIFWKYSFAPNEEIDKLLNKPKSQKQIKPRMEIAKKPITSIFTKPKKPKQNFLEQIKTFLNQKNIQIISLEQVDKKKIIAKVNINSQPHLLVAFNKKRITQAELVKAYKKASEQNLLYYLIAKSEQTKKMQETMQAYKKLFKIDILD